MSRPFNYDTKIKSNIVYKVVYFKLYLVYNVIIILKDYKFLSTVKYS